MEREYDKEILELVSKPIKSDLNCLISISGHKLLRADIVIFKVVLRKWFNRFHTSQISRRLSLINSRINQFVKLNISTSFSAKLGSLIREKFDTRSGKLEYPTYDDVAWIMACSTKACDILCKAIRDIISVFEDCTLWIKLGHFARQMRTITAAVSRLSVFFKTIVMKICDIYPYLYAYLEMLDYVRLEDDQYSRQIFDYLKQINIEPPKNQEIRSSSKAKFRSMYESGKKSEDLGQKVSRNLFNQKQASTGREAGQEEASNVVRPMKNAVSKSGGAFNFLTNGCSGVAGTLKSVAVPRIDSKGSAKVVPNGGASEKVARKELPKPSKDDSFVADTPNGSFVANTPNDSFVSDTLDDSFVSDTLDDSLDRNVSLNNSSLDALPSAMNDDLIRMNGWPDKDLARKKSTKCSSEPLKNSNRKPRKRVLEDDEIERAEIKALIKQFKSRESIRKAKRRRLIRRESMRFEVE